MTAGAVEWEAACERRKKQGMSEKLKREQESRKDPPNHTSETGNAATEDHECESQDRGPHNPSPTPISTAPPGRSDAPPSQFSDVHVCADYQQFVIPTRLTNLPIFVTLLDKTEGSSGFKSNEGLVSFPIE
ncbi:hypothetical protein CK203_041379 [Vitis vinifera]|uniref:Uncharacterized protein n=1 Tax=Vitis vinifera TaxID=29760 RepID=A0A438H5N3_VITVI|nr:hypothetical protein CK203_041379 [Vitis vinifera]